MKNYQDISDTDTLDHEFVGRCVSCGDPSDYCQGHGGSDNWRWETHDEGNHQFCHPSARCPR